MSVRSRTDAGRDKVKQIKRLRDVVAISYKMVGAIAAGADHHLRAA
jgi:hypothetical protein